MEIIISINTSALLDAVLTILTETSEENNQNLQNKLYFNLSFLRNGIFTCHKSPINQFNNFTKSSNW